MTTIIHISDTHFGTEIPKVVLSIEQAITALQPDIIILSGDITQRARVRQFKDAVDFIEKLPAKTKLVVPGNHDIPLFNFFLRLLRPYRNYKKAFFVRETVWCEEGIGILCYDATNPLRHTKGRLNKRQLLRRVREIKKYSPRIIIACAHQPLATAWPQDVSETLIRRDETAQIFSHNDIDLVLSGHVHVPLISTSTVHFPDLKRHIVLAGAGTATSYRTRPGAPNSFNVITINSLEPDSMLITQYDFDDNMSEFKPNHPAKFIRKPQGWEKC